MDKCTIVEKYRGDGNDVPPASSLSRPPARLAGKEDDGLLGSGQSDLDEETPPPGRDTQDEDMPPWSLSVTFEKLANYEPEGKGSEERGNSVEDGAEMLDDGDEQDDMDRIIDGGVKISGMEDIEVRSNDGSRDLRDDEIPIDEQIEEGGGYEF